MGKSFVLDYEKKVAGALLHMLGHVDPLGHLISADGTSIRYDLLSSSEL